MSPEPGPDQGSGFACDVYGIREIPAMTDSTPQTAPSARGHFSARINGTPLITTDLSGMSCLRPELTGARSQRIWKIHAVGKVGPHRTALGLFIDQTLAPGIYDLVRDERLTAVYHLTPKRVAQVFHSRDFAQGRVRLLRCNADTGRLRGSFEFGIPAMNFKVSRGEFDLLCPREEDILALIK
jgi:hypothetical protein